MDNNLNMIGQDRLDALLFDIADEADDGVDYAAMLDTVYKKAAARKKRTAFVKYGSMAAAAAIALAVGGLWFAMNGTAANTNEAAPQAPEFVRRGQRHGGLQRPGSGVPHGCAGACCD